MTEKEWRWIFAENLREKLKYNRMKNYEFAEKIDVTEVTVSRYLNAIKSPKLSTLLKMCDVFGCTLDELVV